MNYLTSHTFSPLAVDLISIFTPFARLAELRGGKLHQFETLLEIYEVLKCFIPRGWFASCHW